MPEQRETTERFQVKTGRQIVLFHCALLLSVAAYADDIRITPTLNLMETYNDNVYLSSNGTQNSAFISEVMPGILVSADGPSFKLHLDYAVQELLYSGETHSEQTNQILSANSKEEIIKDLFYFENSANISQQNYSAFAPQTPNNQTLSGNLYETRTYDLEPYLKTNFGQDASAELRFIHNYINATDGGLLDSVSNTVRTVVKSGPAFKTVDWNLLYSDEKINYTNQNDLEMQSTTLSSGYHLSSEFALTASAGYEKNNYLTPDGKTPEGSDWSLGFSWTPSARTKLSASFGRHYYGNTYSLIANERTYATVWNLGYSDGLTTSRSQLFVPSATNTSDFLNALWMSSIPDATQRQQAVDAFIQSNGLPGTLTTPVNTVTDQVFLQRYLQGSVALSGLRNTLIFSVFNIRRDVQSLPVSTVSSDISQNNNTKQTGANIMLNHNFTPRTNYSLMISRSKSVDETANITFDSNMLTTSLNHQWDPRLRATLEYQYIQSTSNFFIGSAKNNILSLMLAFKF